MAKDRTPDEGKSPSEEDRYEQDGSGAAMPANADEEKLFPSGA